MKIMVFLHGTAIGHKTENGVSREEKVKQSERRDPAVLDYANYTPVGNAVQKLKDWEKQGAEILYLSSHESQEDVDKDQLVLDKYDFTKGSIFWRKHGQSYAQVVEEVVPDVLIEDDCESIGGEIEMTYPHINPKLKEQIKSIVVKEFAGVDHLPFNITDL